MSAKPLPCFCVVNELSLSFETDAESLRGENICFSLILLFFRIFLSLLFTRFNLLNGLSLQTFFRFLLCIYHFLPIYLFPSFLIFFFHSFLPFFVSLFLPVCHLVSVGSSIFLFVFLSHIMMFPNNYIF